jgi:hypothetical protein
MGCYPTKATYGWVEKSKLYARSALPNAKKTYSPEDCFCKITRHILMLYSSYYIFVAWLRMLQ